MRNSRLKSFFYFAFVLFLFAPFLKATEIMIDNFEATSNVNWDYLSDQVMGGVSQGSARLAIDSDVGNTYVQMTGDVSTENNGGFIQLRTRLPSGADQDVLGVYLRARGNNQKYFIHLRTRGTILPWQYYQAEFDVSEDWQMFRLPLSQFKPSGSWLGKSPSARSIRSLGIVAFGRDHRANIYVDEIGFYD